MGKWGNPELIDTIPLNALYDETMCNATTVIFIFSFFPTEGSVVTLSGDLRNYQRKVPGVVLQNWRVQEGPKDLHEVCIHNSSSSCSFQTFFVSENKCGDS